MMSSGSKLERKVVERNRRTQMKHLCFKLVSLIPPQHFNPPKEFLSQQDQIEQAATYIHKLSHSVEKLKKRNAAHPQLLRIDSYNHKLNNTKTGGSESLPILKIRDIGGSALEIVVITRSDTNFALNRAVRALEEEGAEVVTLSISNMGDRIFHTLYAQAKFPRVGVDIARISGRLEEMTVF